MRIVSQAIPSGNAPGYERGLQDAGRGLARAVAARLAVDAPFAEREQAVLQAANEVCRRLLESTLEATADRRMSIACGWRRSSMRVTTREPSRITVCVGR